MNTGLPQAAHVIPRSHLAAVSTSLPPYAHHPCRNAAQSAFTKLAGPFSRVAGTACQGSSPRWTLSSPNSWCQKQRFSQNLLCKCSVAPMGNHSLWTQQCCQWHEGVGSVWSGTEILGESCSFVPCFSLQAVHLGAPSTGRVPGQNSNEDRPWLHKLATETSAHVYCASIHVRPPGN